MHTFDPEIEVFIPAVADAHGAILHAGWIRDVDVELAVLAAFDYGDAGADCGGVAGEDGYSSAFVSF